MFDSLSVILGFLPLRSVWVVGGDFNSEIGFQGVGEESMIGRLAISLVLYTTTLQGYVVPP